MCNLRKKSDMSVCQFLSVNFCLGLPICLSVCLSIYAFICLFVCFSVCLLICLSMSICVCLCLFLSLSVSLSICLFLPACVFVCVCLSLCVCLSVRPWHAYIANVFFLAFHEVGGINALWEKFGEIASSNMTAHTMGNITVNMTGNITANMTNTTMNNCYSMTSYWGNMFRPLSDPEYPWIGLWVALPIIGIWYWCTDQVRLLGARVAGT